jgi:hypothetical protein
MNPPKSGLRCGFFFVEHPLFMGFEEGVPNNDIEYIFNQDKHNGFEVLG